MRKQEYTFNKNSCYDFNDFCKSFHDFGFPDISNSASVSQQFLEFVYNNIKSDTVTFVNGPRDGVYSIYSGKTLLVKIRDGHLVKLVMPWLSSKDKNAAFLGSDGMEYVTEACFQNLEDAGNDFMQHAREARYVLLPNMKTTGRNFLRYALKLEVMDIPSNTKLGDDAFGACESLKRLHGSNMTTWGNRVLYENNAMQELSLQSLKKMGNGCLASNTQLILAPYIDKHGNEYPGDICAPCITRAGEDCIPVIYKIIAQNRAKHK